MSEEQKDAPNIMMLPPTLVLMHVAVGLTLNWIIPFSIGHIWGWLGLLLLALAFVIIKWSRDLFEKAGTNVPPNKPALVIVKEGPYRYTRNPMYLSFLLGFVGLALLADAPMMLLTTASLFYFLDRRIILPEETYLTEKFGQTYIDYKDTVRRWI